MYVCMCKHFKSYRINPRLLVLGYVSQVCFKGVLWMYASGTVQEIAGVDQGEFRRYVSRVCLVFFPQQLKALGSQPR